MNKLLILTLILLATTNANVVEKLIRNKLLAQVYSPTDAHQLFYYTKVVTCNLADINSWNCGYYCQMTPGMTEVQSWYKEAHSAQAYVGFNKNQNHIVVVYRSTQDATNWLNNIKFFKHNFGDCKDCQVHLGFWETYDDLSAPVITYANTLKAKYPSAKLVVAGHSLGGAVAALTAVDLTRSGHKIDYFFTYGAPRVGNAEFAAWFKTFVDPVYHWRVTHYQDIVIHSPPMSFYYAHLTQEVWYNRENTMFRICYDDTKEDDTCANSQWATSMADHTSYFNEQQPCRTTFVLPDHDVLE